MVNQDYTYTQDDIFWFYDTDLNYIDKIDGFGSMLNSWAASVGGSWQQGDVCFWPGLFVDYSGNQGYDAVITDADKAVRLIPFEYSTDDAYVLALGDGYIGFYRTE